MPRHVEQEITDALEKSGTEAKKIIRGDAPIDDGELRASIDWTFGDPPPGVLGANDTPRDNGIPARLRLSIYAGGKKAPHAHLVHNGTKPRFKKDGRSTGVMPPQPFFWPNIRSLRKRFRNRILRHARRGLKRGLE